MTAHLADTPVLETARLTLRAPRMEDYPVLERFVCSDRAQYILTETGTPRIAWRALAHITGMWALRGFGAFVFCDKSSGDPLGIAGPWYPLEWPEPEIAWSVWEARAEGKGYAFEAAEAARAYAFRDLGWSTAVSYIIPENARSIALAERMGCQRDDGAPKLGAGEPEVLVYRHLKEAA